MLLHHRLFGQPASKGLMQRHTYASCSTNPLATQSSLTRSPSRASSCSNNGLFTAAALAEFLQREGLQEQCTRIVHTLHEPIPAEAVHFKTMILIRDDVGSAGLQRGPAPQAAAASAAAVCVLLLAGDKVDLRAVAQHMQLPRGSLRLATAEEAVSSTGYELGEIPPLGHKHLLRTLVDAHIAQQGPQRLLCAGGGSKDMQLLLSVQQLLSVTAGEVAAFSTTQQPGRLRQAIAQQQPAELQQQLQQLGPAAFAHFPAPWPAGAEEVELFGVVAQRRRVAKLLLFATLVPETVPVLPSDGTAAYVRRLWRHPVTGMPCEVQLILGKTIERQLGRDGAAALFDNLKVGSVVGLRGRPQQHPQQPGLAADSNGQHQHVLDVVVQAARVLHKSRDSLTRAIRSAQRRGATCVSSAADLERLGAHQSRAAAEPCAEADLDQVAPADEAHQHAAGTAACGAYAAAASAPAAGKGAPPRASTAAVKAAASTVPHGQRMQQQADSSADFYPFALSPQAITLVDDLKGVVRMHQAVLQQAPQHSAGADKACSEHDTWPSQDSRRRDSSIHSSSSSSSSGRVAIVGLDCEWQPFVRGLPRSPVALLQLATRDWVYLVDTLAICRQQQQQQHGQSASNSSSSTNSSQEENADSSASCLNSSTPAEEALAYFLQQLFAHEGIRVVGFGLQGDLQRLANSYPWLLAAAHTNASSSSSSSSIGTSIDVQTPQLASGAQAAPGPCGTQSGQAADGACTLVVNANHASGTPAGVAVPEQAEGNDKQAGCGWVVRQAVELQQLGSKGSTDGRRVSGQVGSLSLLVKQTLGQPLNKEQQASDWGLRPLSEAQLVYAANDAHVLTVLYDELVAAAAVGQL